MCDEQGSKKQVLDDRILAWMGDFPLHNWVNNTVIYKTWGQGGGTSCRDALTRLDQAGFIEFDDLTQSWRITRDGVESMDPDFPPTPQKYRLVWPSPNLGAHSSEEHLGHSLPESLVKEAMWLADKLGNTVDIQVKYGGSKLFEIYAIIAPGG